MSKPPGPGARPSPARRGVCTAGSPVGLHSPQPSGHGPNAGATRFTAPRYNSHLSSSTPSPGLSAPHRGQTPTAQPAPHSSCEHDERRRPREAAGSGESGTIPALAGNHKTDLPTTFPYPRRRTIGTPPSRSGLCSPREAPWGGPRPHVESGQPSLGRAVQLPDQLHGLLAEHGPGTWPFGPPALTQTAASLTGPFGFRSYCSQERSADPASAPFGRQNGGQ